MEFINFLIGIANGPYSFQVKCAASFCFLMMLACGVGGFAVVLNGLYWTWVRRSLKKKSARLIAERTQRLDFESKA